MGCSSSAPTKSTAVSPSGQPKISPDPIGAPAQEYLDAYSDIQAAATEGGTPTATAAPPKTPQKIELLEQEVLSNNGKPIEEVMCMIEKTGDYMERLDKEKENKTILAWLQKALLHAHHSTKIKSWVKKLLAAVGFTNNMSYMKIFAPLQTFCQQELLKIGKPLHQLYQKQNYSQKLGSFMPPLHPQLLQQQEESQQKIHLRQDHSLIGLVPSPTMDLSTFTGESSYLHFLRLVAYILNDEYQTRVDQIVKPLGGDRKGCAIKGDARMRNKALAKDDHRYESKPRPALNIDIVRCCVTFNSPELLINGVNAVVREFSAGGGGIGRIKNGFASSEQIAATSFHYRSFMVNIIVDFNCTFGELCQRNDVIAMLLKYVNAPPENPQQSWCQWKRDAEAAVAYFKSPAMASQRVIMVCEVQFLLRQYLEARKHMHLLYKIVRATSAPHLATQFSVSTVEGRPKEATFESEELRMVEETKGYVKRGFAFALLNACFNGFVAAVNIALAVKDVNVNQDNDGMTPLFIGCQEGHFDVVQVLLTKKEIEINQANNNGTTPLFIACQKGHFDVVQVLLTKKEIEINQAENDGMTPLFMACQNGHFDVVQVLLTKKEIEINQSNKKNSTPINIASDKGHTEIVRLLLQQPNIDIQKIDDWGDTPESSASKKGFTEIVTLLQQHGAK